MDVRKLVTLRERVSRVHDRAVDRPTTRVVGIAVFENPYAGRFEADLSPLFGVGFEIAEQLMEEMLPLLPGPAESYGKAAIVGAAGDLEQAHALLHPELGKAIRPRIGGGKALIPSAAKQGPAGASLDIPLGHKDDAWSRPHFDAISVALPDAPLPHEILLAIALADGGRPIPRTAS